MGGDSSAPALVEVFASEKAEWEMSIKYCAKLWFKKRVEAVMKRVKKWYNDTFSFVLIKECTNEGILEIHIAKKSKLVQYQGGSVYTKTWLGSLSSSFDSGISK